MRIVTTGITRRVVLIGPFAVKVPQPGHLIRGWLANQSEWRQRDRPGVNRPLATLAHVAVIFRRAHTVAWDGEILRTYPLADAWAAWEADDDADDWEPSTVWNRDEAKPSSWGLFTDGEWRCLDYDRAWEDDQRGLIGRWYWGRQERNAARWAHLEGAADG